MSFQLFLSLIFLSLVCFMFVVPVTNQSLGASELFRTCNIPFRCGNFTADYPFWGNGRPIDCGIPELGLFCRKDRPIIVINDVSYVMLNVNVKAKTFRVARKDYLNGICSPRFINTTLNSQVIGYVPEHEMVTLLYACPLSPSLSGHFTCPFTGVDYKDGYIVAEANGPGTCLASVSVPIPKTSLPTLKEKPSVFERTLRDGFELKWDVGGIECEKCRESLGICAYELNQTSCHCRNGQFSNSTVCYAQSISSGQSSNDHNKENKPFFNKSRKISIGITASVVGIIILSILFVGLGQFWTKKTEDDQKIEAFFRNCPSLVPQRYNYSDVKTMTQSFSNKLGRGGYGDVYKGKLADGHLVAVKVLKESRGNGEEFINEVVSISQTSHVNIVTLRGFCFERKKRALIYEFMANGSLDKFIYIQESSSSKCNLEWKTMYQIAIGIARGLEYLHRGCNTRIVHFDIKPHNILLDENFCPKISDFGLAKQSNKRESIMSMLHARGTVGYIAPEVFCRNFGGVSYKSDVYSYGMMTLEIVGGRKNINPTVSHTSEIYFPDSIYKLLEMKNDSKLQGVGTEEEEEMAKKMILVSLWCIQTNPSDRPSMSKVVEMLEGSLEDLQIPPKPSLSSPPRSPKHISTISSLTELASQEEQCIRQSDISQN